MTSEEVQAMIDKTRAVLEKRWESENAPVICYSVKLHCSARAFREAVEIVAGSGVSIRRMVYNSLNDPSALLEFECTYEKWEVLRDAIQSVPAKGRWCHQSANWD